MAKIFITGSADGLGLGAAKTLLAEGHQVILHARSQERLSAVKDLLDQGAHAIAGDLSDLKQTINVAEQINKMGRMDAVIHNAGVYEGKALIPVNVVAPYVLTALITRPERLIYVSSGMHLGGDEKSLSKVDFAGKNISCTYSDTKLFVTTFANAIARRWKDVISSSLHPGWVPTKMGGANATDNLREGHLTQEWLATSTQAEALKSGGYWFHKKLQKPHASSLDENFQHELIKKLEATTGILLPKA
jgi:NAD(P)-dependent dehydrogenase (short-subunit alcohol dehydrogenase family)